MKIEKSPLGEPSSLGDRLRSPVGVALISAEADFSLKGVAVVNSNAS